MPSSAPGGDRRSGDGRRGELDRLAHGRRRPASRRGRACRRSRRGRRSPRRPPSTRGSVRRSSARLRDRRMPHRARRSRHPARSLRRAAGMRFMSSHERERGDDAGHGRTGSSRAVRHPPASSRRRRRRRRTRASRRAPTGGATARAVPRRRRRGRATIAMPTRSASLSFVPNSAIAASFAHGGARSMSADPITAKGLASGAMSAAVSSPSPAPSTADATPAAAAARRRLLGRAATARAYARAAASGARSRTPAAGGQPPGECGGWHRVPGRAAPLPSVTSDRPIRPDRPRETIMNTSQNTVAAPRSAPQASPGPARLRWHGPLIALAATMAVTGVVSVVGLLLDDRRARRSADLGEALQVLGVDPHLRRHVGVAHRAAASLPPHGVVGGHGHLGDALRRDGRGLQPDDPRRAQPLQPADAVRRASSGRSWAPPSRCCGSRPSSRRSCCGSLPYADRARTLAVRLGAVICLVGLRSAS